MLPYVIVSFAMCITGAEFDKHCSKLSGDILNSVFYCLSGTYMYDVITSSFAACKNVNISKGK